MITATLDALPLQLGTKINNLKIVLLSEYQNTRIFSDPVHVYKEISLPLQSKK